MKRKHSALSAQTVNVASTKYLKHIILDFQQMQEFCKDPFILTRAWGVKYEDIQGKIYLDGLSGIFVVNVGHNNRRVIEAMKKQLDRLAFAPPLHGTNDVALELTKLLSEITPRTLKTVKLLSGGSEATEAAIKFARQYHKQSGHPQKFKIISRYMGYHGATLGALSATGTTKRKTIFEPLLTGFVKVHPPHCYRCPLEKEYPRCNVFCARIVGDIIKYEGPETVAALMVEPIMNTGGIITPPMEYYPILREICDRHNVLLIFDEIITGFGRTGKMFGADTFQTVPDIICCGKGMSSGYAPLAATIISDKVASAFWGPGEAGIEFAHGHTYGGNPVSCAAGIASIEEIIERKLPENAQKMGEYLKEKLQELNKFGIVGEIRGKGLMIGVELVKDPQTKAQFDDSIAIGVRIGKTALKKGLIIRYDPHWIALAPPLIVTERDIDEMVEILMESTDEVIRELKKGKMDERTFISKL